MKDNVSQPREGVWISRTGKLKVFSVENGKWILDSGRTKRLKFFGLKAHVVEEMSIGWPIWAYGLKNCEWLGDL